MYGFSVLVELLDVELLELEPEVELLEPEVELEEPVVPVAPVEPLAPDELPFAVELAFGKYWAGFSTSKPGTVAPANGALRMSEPIYDVLIVPMLAGFERAGLGTLPNFTGS